MKPFNLERALAGDSVVTRNNIKVKELHFFETINKLCIAVLLVSGITFFVTKEGKCINCVGEYVTHLDLFMAPKNKKLWVAVCIEPDGDGDGDHLTFDYAMSSLKKLKNSVFSDHIYENKIINFIEIEIEE